MIECINLVKSYQKKSDLVRAVDNVNFRIEDGDFILIGGRSGSGKTTLLSMIGGLTSPSKGIIQFDGANIWTKSDLELSKFRAKTVGFVFQFSGLLPSLTVLENVMLPTIFADINDARKRAEELLNYVGLGNKLRSYPSELSGGEMKRTAIARALVNSPKLLLADEPTGDLDVETEQEVMELFKKINLNGTTIVMVTHNVDLTTYSKHFYRMAKGKLTLNS